MTKKNRANNRTGLAISAETLEQAAAEYPRERFVLTLYISGMTPRSRRAINNIQKLCEQHLTGNYDLEIIDIYQQPALAKSEQIVAVPTLIKKMPPPLRRMIGDMSDPGRILVALGVVPAAAEKK